MHIIKITIQEKNLSVKSAFEILSAKFGVKIHRYHADNGRFAEQPFISSIEEANQTITFCGVRYHNQNSIVESKIQILTIGSIALHIHEKCIC